MGSTGTGTGTGTATITSPPTQPNPPHQPPQSQEESEPQTQGVSSTPATTSAAASSRRLPLPCWSHEETLALIQAYRDKWYSLNRGNLKACHWQQVAEQVGLSCPLIKPPKTSLQCRHKIEKLRKRYRSDKSRHSSWPFYPLMHSLEHGPNSHTTDPDPNPNISRSRPRSRSRSKSRSLLRITAASPAPASAAASAPRPATRIKIVKREPIVSPQPMVNYALSEEVDDDEDDDDEEDEERDYEEKQPRYAVTVAKRIKGRGGHADAAAAAATEMVAAVKLLGEGFLRMERRKMEMTRDLERMRMEMEMKRTEMILESQQRIVEAFVDRFLEGVKSDKSTTAAAPAPAPAPASTLVAEMDD